MSRSDLLTHSNMTPLISRGEAGSGGQLEGREGEGGGGKVEWEGEGGGGAREVQVDYQVRCPR